MAANYSDAAAGWSIFRDRRGKVSLTQLNQALRAQGHEPIAKRTYGHYSKLLRLGYSEYVSINRLDIRHANDTIFDISDRSRYSDRDFASPGRLLIPTGTTVDELSGVLVRVSEGFATLQVADTDAARRAARAVKYNKGVLVFDEVGVDRAVEVVEGSPSGDSLDLLLQFRSLLETDLILPSADVAIGTSRLIVDLGAGPSLYQVIHVLRATFDLYESVRAFSDLALNSADLAAGPFPTPRIEYLRVRNPVVTAITGATGVPRLIRWLVRQVTGSVQEVAEATAAVQGVVHSSAEEERRRERHQRDAERHELEMQSLQLDAMKKRIEVADMLAELSPEAAALLPQLDPSARARLEAYKDQAVEASSELTQISRGDLSVQDVSAEEPRDDNAPDE